MLVFVSRTLPAIVLALAVTGAGAATLPQTSTPGAQQNRTWQTQEYYQQRKTSERPSMPGNPVIGPRQPSPSKGGGHKGPTFVLKDVRFNKSHFLKPRVLAGVVKPFVGHKVTVADLRTIVARINKLYTQHDIYTARAVLPPQRIRHGVVHIELIEGRLGKLEIKDNHYTKASFIRARISQQPGKVVDGAALKDDLIFFNRTSDVQLRALLRPGAEKGLTRILLLAQEPPRVQIGVFVDDAGATSTGRYRAGATFRLHGPFHRDDRLVGYFVGSRGARDGFVSYSVPVNDSNGRFGVSYSRDSINIIKGPSQALDITGHASTETVQFIQPFIATQHWLVRWASSISHTSSRTEAQGTPIANAKTENLSTGVTVQRNTRRYQWSLTQTASAAHSRETLDSRHNFFVYHGYGNYLRALGTGPYSLVVKGSMQYSPADQLPDTELFQIGGVGSVRGYEPGVVAGSSGLSAQIELHRAFKPKVDGFLFLDAGAVYQAFPKDESISGVGAGTSFQLGRQVTGSVDLGVPLKTVMPDQDNYRIDFRLTAHWNP